MKRYSKENSTDLIDTFFGLHHSSVTDNKTFIAMFDVDVANIER